jgi:hypothetical protein
MKKDSQNFWQKLRLFAMLKCPFSRRGKKVAVDGEGSPPTSSSYQVDMSMVDAAANGVAPSHIRADTDATSTIRGSRSSFGVNASQLGPVAIPGGRELGSIDGRVRSLLYIIA